MLALFENVGNLPTLVYQTQPDYLKKPEGDTSKWAKMAYTFENTSPYDYLKSKMKGAEPTKRDLNLIEDLMIDQKLSAGVVNVLISYALKINNQKLNRNYLETIAGQWKKQFQFPKALRNSKNKLPSDFFCSNKRRFTIACGRKM